MTAEHIFRRIPQLNLSLGMSHFFPENGYTSFRQIQNLLNIIRHFS